jgi:hypothetical protein
MLKHHAMKVCGENGGIAPHTPNIDTSKLISKTVPLRHAI